MSSLSNFFLGNPVWNRPTHSANRFAITAGQSRCICIPSTSNRVVVEMWGQGGGGAPGRCCSWGCTGGQGGAYAYRVWEGASSPQGVGTCFSFCGCVCACDCRAFCTMAGHPGQFSRLTNCNAAGGAGIGSWIGCVQGGAGGIQAQLSTSWVCANFGCNFNTQYDTGCIRTPPSGKPEFYAIICGSCALDSTCVGGSCFCCVGASCYCAELLCSATCVGPAHTTAEICASAAGGAGACGINVIFPVVSCACWCVYRLGSCGWAKNTPILTACTTWNYCDQGVGGHSWGGGQQQKRNAAMGQYAYCGFAGHFPGGGGSSSGACGGGCCCAAIGGGGLILISWA